MRLAYTSAVTKQIFYSKIKMASGFLRPGFYRYEQPGSEFQPCREIWGYDAVVSPYFLTFITSSLFFKEGRA